MKILYTLVLITLTEALKNDWVDPHAMNIKSKQKLPRSFSENSKESIQNTTPPPSVEENMSLIYLKRTVSLLLNAASPEKDDRKVFTGSYHYVIDSEEYKFLMDFTNDKHINTEDIRRLDTVLSTLFSKPYQEGFFNFNIGLDKEDIFRNLFQIEVLITLGITVCLFILYILLRNNYGFLYIIGYFISIMLIVDYGFRYRYLYEEAEEHNHKVTYTSECDTTKMNWSEYFKFVTSQRNCEKKIVTPLDVGLNQLKYMIIIPLESIGTGMGKFGKELWEKLPFPWNILIFPIMLIFILWILIIFVLAAKNTGFKLKLFHLFQLEFPGKRNEEGDRVSGKNLDKLLDATTHRRMVEDTRSSPVKREQKAIRNKNTPPKKEKNGATISNKVTPPKEEKYGEKIDKKNTPPNEEKNGARINNKITPPKKEKYGEKTNNKTTPPKEEKNGMIDKATPTNKNASAEKETENSQTVSNNSDASPRTATADIKDSAHTDKPGNGSSEIERTDSTK